MMYIDMQQVAITSLCILKSCDKSLSFISLICNDFAYRYGNMSTVIK